MKEINIADYDYPLPDERIAKYPVENREMSKLLLKRDNKISHTTFCELGKWLPKEPMLVFNNTKVVRARIIMHRPSGAQIEILCLEPAEPADYERAFAATATSKWHCIVGNLKRWKEGPVQIPFKYNEEDCLLQAFREQTAAEGNDNIVRFEWDAPLTFGALLEHLGKMPIPPYLNRDTQDIDYTRYQTVYSKFEGSVAAPTAGLHFTERLIGELKNNGVETEEVTLHVGAGTFLPVKEQDATKHPMHTEHFEIRRSTLDNLIRKNGHIVAVGTTSVRTLESLPALGYRVLKNGSPETEHVIGQFELYDIPTEHSGKELLTALRDYMVANKIETLKTATQIMIMPSFRFRVVNALITNFHQPKSTLLLLIAAFIGDDWHKVYRYALDNDFRFLSYGDSSLLMPSECGKAI